MIRPGISDPRVGAMRTAQMREKLRRALAKQMAAPRLGGLSRRPVAGPGVRSFGNGGPLHPAALSALVNRLSNAVIPMQAAIPGLPPQAQPGSLDVLPDPASGARPDDAFHPIGPGPGGRVGIGSQSPVGPGPSQPFLAPGETETLQSPLMGGLAEQVGVQGGTGNLIPLGGGNYYDVSTGMLHGPGGFSAL